MMSPRALTKEFARADIPLGFLHMHRGIPDPRAPFRLAELVRDFRPVVVHSHMVHANLLARISRPLHRAPVAVSTVHSTHEGSRWRERAIRLTDPLCDLTTGVSQASVDRYIRKKLAPTNKIRLVRNGVDTARFQPDPALRRRIRHKLAVDENFVWLAVGRFETAKDYPTLFRAFAQSVETEPHSLLLIAGDGPLRNRLQEVIREVTLDKNVRFLGVRRDIPDLMSAADAYVTSSAWEGLPIALLEASATALPIVATDVGGIPDIVLHGETGYLVPPREPSALASAMMKMVALSGTERQRLGTRGQVHVRNNFAIEGVVDTWEQLYDDLLRKVAKKAGIGH